MDVSAKITGIKYTPFLCRELKVYDISNLEDALSKDSSFLIAISNREQIALSWWVSPKRTRSYPYARVYDTLGYQTKRVTIIPILKDEGKEGDRDFLQWDTISLMSLLGVYTIIAYYNDAEKSFKYKHKITNQKFDISYLKEMINKLLIYHSDALHWNLEQIKDVGKIAQTALDMYEEISKKLQIEMHSKDSAQKRIKQLLKGKESFMMVSRNLAKKAQKRESMTVQPKEKLSGLKATLTIENYLGGYYYFTCDEVNIKKDNIYLIECKHSKQGPIPSLDDIKDGLLKMILYTNLSEVKIGNREYSSIPVLKLTSDLKFSRDTLRKSEVDYLQKLKIEAEKNNFKVVINDKDLQEIDI